MSDIVTIIDNQNLPSSRTWELKQLSNSMNDYLRASKAKNTVRAYQSDWDQFTKWCHRFGFQALPADEEVVGAYISFLADNGRKTSTIRRHLTSIAEAHRAAKSETIPSDTFYVRQIWKGIKHSKKMATTQKVAAVIADIRRMVDAQPPSLMGLRNKMILLIGYAGAFRRSEIVSLDWEDVQFVREGMIVTLRQSKTDQEGEGRKVGIQYGTRWETCPVRGLQEWMEQSKAQSGPIFRRFDRFGQVTKHRLSAQSVALVVKDAARSAGLDATQYSGHSLRAGSATQGAKSGAGESVIMKQTGHTSSDMVRRYIRDGNLFRDNLTSYLGL